MREGLEGGSKKRLWYPDTMLDVIGKSSDVLDGVKGLS